MTWRIASASAAGTSHILRGIPCEDSCSAFIERPASQPPMLAVFVSDGAGSAVHGGIGAELAIEAASGYFSWLHETSGSFLPNKKMAFDCLQHIRAKLIEAAEKRGISIRDFACTFLGVLTSTSSTVLLQIGDGGIVLDTGNGLELPIVPMSGEYANTTSFITDNNALEIAAVVELPKPAKKIAAFSDGIQRMALDMTSHQPYEPFFNPFFEILKKASEDQEALLGEELKSFLNSPAVNRRTDDDKTLVLAHISDSDSA